MKKWLFGVLGLVVVMGVSVVNAQTTSNPAIDWIIGLITEEWFLEELHRFHATPEQVAEWRAAAEQGDADAQAKLGSAYATGKGVDKDHREAVRWLRAAAEQGHARAQLILGSAYANGNGVTEDQREAVRWFRAAAEQGHAEAQYKLGDAYTNGEGVAKDYSEGARWYRAAAEQGHAEAQYELAWAYVIDNGVTDTEDNREAVRWFRAAAEQGHMLAQDLLRTLKNLRRSNEWFGEVLHRFHATPEQVAEWHAAAEQGDADAQYKLGSAYATGKGVAKDNHEAVRWFRAAAEQGHADAQFIEAVRWYRVAAADQEHVRRDLFWAVRDTRIPVTGWLRTVAGWLRAAAEQGHAEAQFILGNAYAPYSLVSAKDHREAVRWFRAAAEQGHAEARLWLRGLENLPPE